MTDTDDDTADPFDNLKVAMVLPTIGALGVFHPARHAAGGHAISALDFE
ncbi:MAG TPA: hypothetical protein VES20_03085 [Bryobacteraceae bacterium]|nr:hypothetical protein [Bryobacteraceae bacterium]